MKSYHHGNLKQELIDCACRLCERDGYTKLSIRSLAKESGVSQTAPYRHFETKETLYASVATEGFKKLSIACHIDANKNITKIVKLYYDDNSLHSIHEYDGKSTLKEVYVKGHFMGHFIPSYLGQQILIVNTVIPEDDRVSL